MPLLPWWIGHRRRSGASCAGASSSSGTAYAVTRFFPVATGDSVSSGSADCLLQYAATAHGLAWSTGRSAALGYVYIIGSWAPTITRRASYGDEDELIPAYAGPRSARMRAGE